MRINRRLFDCPLFYYYIERTIFVLFNFIFCFRLYLAYKPDRTQEIVINERERGKIKKKTNKQTQMPLNLNKQLPLHFLSLSHFITLLFVLIFEMNRIEQNQLFKKMRIIIKKFVYSNYFIIFYIIYSSPLQMLFVCLSSINTKIATTTAAAKYNGNEIKSNAHLD